MEEKFLKKLGERIKKIRKEKNISQEYISLQTGISMNTISCIELGKTSAKIDTINKIAKTLGIELNDLFLCEQKISKDKNNSLNITEKLSNLSQKELTKLNKIIDIFLE